MNFATRHFRIRCRMGRPSYNASCEDSLRKQRTLPGQRTIVRLSFPLGPCGVASGGPTSVGFRWRLVGFHDHGSSDLVLNRLQIRIP